MLGNRTFNVKVEEELSQERNIKAGAPQRSVLGPLLYNLYRHDISKIPGMEIALHADATVKNKNLNYLEKKCKKCIEKI